MSILLNSYETTSNGGKSLSICTLYIEGTEKNPKSELDKRPYLISLSNTKNDIVMNGTKETFEGTDIYYLINLVPFVHSIRCEELRIYEDHVRHFKEIIILLKPEIKFFFSSRTIFNQFTSQSKKDIILRSISDNSLVSRKIKYYAYYPLKTYLYYLILSFVTNKTIRKISIMYTHQILEEDISVISNNLFALMDLLLNHNATIYEFLFKLKYSAMYTLPSQIFSVKNKLELNRLNENTREKNSSFVSMVSQHLKIN